MKTREPFPIPASERRFPTVAERRSSESPTRKYSATEIQAVLGTEAPQRASACSWKKRSSITRPSRPPEFGCLTPSFSNALKYPSGFAGGKERKRNVPVSSNRLPFEVPKISERVLASVRTVLTPEPEIIDDSNAASVSWSKWVPSNKAFSGTESTGAPTNQTVRFPSLGNGAESPEPVSGSFQVSFASAIATAKASAKSASSFDAFGLSGSLNPSGFGIVRFSFIL